MIFRFYFYTFYIYYDRKNWESTDAWFRAWFTVSFSLLFLVNICLMIIGEIAEVKVVTRFIIAINTITSFGIIYFFYVSNRKYIEIVNEFKNHRINTVNNRKLCWMILLLIFLIQLGLPLLIHNLDIWDVHLSIVFPTPL